MPNAYSAVKVFHHKDALDAIGQGRHIAPFYIRLKPTNFCNHHCAYCTYGSGGEPLTYQHIAEAARLMAGQGIELSLISNGQLLQGEDNVKFAAVIENVPHYHAGIKDEVIEQLHRAQVDFADEKFAIINRYEQDWTDMWHRCH